MDIDKRTMESLRELAKIEGEISTGKATIMQMKKDLDVFLDERAELENKKIQQVLAESDEIVKKIGQNYDLMSDYYKMAASFTKFFVEIENNLNKSIELFLKEKQLNDKKINKDIEKLSVLKLSLDNQQKSINADKKFIEERNKALLKLQNHIYQQQQSTRDALKAIKGVK